MVSRRTASTVFFAALAVVTWMASGIYIINDDNEDYSEGYTGLIGEWAPIEKLGTEAEGKIRLFVYQTLAEHGMSPPSLEVPMQFASLKFMRTTGSTLKTKNNKRDLVFGGMANLTTSDGGYATVFIDNKGTGMVVTRVRGPPNATLEEGEEKGVKEENTPKPEPKPSSNKLRVLSYNIWNYNGDWRKRIELLSDEVCSPDYDAVALQELRYESWAGEAELGRLQIEHLVKECRSRGVELSYVWQPAMMYPHNVQKKGTYEIEGVAILTPHRIVGVERRFLARSLWDSEDGHQRVVLAARICAPSAGEFTFISTHFSLSDAMEVSNAHEMAEFADALAKERWPGPVIAMGDYNAEPSSSAYAYLTGEAGFGDAWTAAAAREGPENGFSWARVPGDPTTKRCDYCFYKNFGGAAPVKIAPAVATIPSEFHCVVNGEGEDEEDDENIVIGEPQPPKPSRTCASDHLPLSVEFIVTEVARDEPSSSSSSSSSLDNDVPVKEEL